MKTCTRCNLPKDESEFSFRSKIKNTLHCHCKECRRAADKEAYSKGDRALKIRNRATNQIITSKQYIQDVKKRGSCVKCNDNRWYVLDFHHLRDKTLSVSDMGVRGASLKTIQEEIDKCELLCANCHREVHFLDKKLTR